MASTDGQRLEVFGLGFRQHDNRSMQRILREHGSLPDNPGDRAGLFIALTALAKELGAEKSERITNWLRNGGEFPSPNVVMPDQEFGRGQQDISRDNTWRRNDTRTAPNSYSGHSRPGFLGSGRTLVDIDDITPEFPMANAHDESPALRQLVESEDMDLEEFNGRRNENSGIQNEDEDMAENDDEAMDDNITWPEDPPHDMNGPEWDMNEDVNETDEENVPQNMTAPPTAVHRSHFPAMIPPYAHPLAQEEIPKNYLECCICAESLDPTRFPTSSKLTSNCEHPEDAVACLECIHRSIRGPIDEGLINLICCPMCPEKLSADDIKKYASDRVFARYQYLLMSLNPDMVFCLALSCGNGQVHSVPELGPVMTCSKCSFRTCVNHKLPWHEGQTCDEFDCDDSQVERLEQDEATAKLLASLASKICPTCKQGVDRTDGCDHLMCRCGGEWCFECLASWENILRLGMEAHAPTCKNHPRRVQLRADQKKSNEAKILESVHGGKVSEALLKAREQRNIRNRERIRPLALEAAEKRAKEEAAAKREKGKEQVGSSSSGKPKVRLIPAWQEQ